MGIEPFLLGSSLIGVLAQRLVRRLCPACRQPFMPTAREWQAVSAGPAPRRAYRAVGCAECNQTGYRGRTGLYELLRVDDGLRRLIHEGAGEHAIRDHARRLGMRSLREDAQRWLEEGTTSIEEILRATREAA
jgi:general secretion pathway protein E